jgi:prepilin-type processing-associated H-X9-DG protein
MAITKEIAAEYTELAAKADALEREAKTFRDRQKQIELMFEAELKESGKTSIIRHGYTLAWTNGRANVAWADEYLKECGPVKANALKQAAGFVATASKMLILPPVPIPSPKEE